MRVRAQPGGKPGTTSHRQVIWHDVECGGYGSDLALWHELADRAAGPILELGCGTGRLTLDLARLGHEILGIDTQPELVSALRARAADRGLAVDAQVSDMRALALDRRFALIAMPMQVLQLLASPIERRAALIGAATALTAGGTLAVALVEDLPPPDDEAAPLPDVAEDDGWVYSSLPLAVTREGERLRVTRLRQVVSPAGELSEEVNVVSLAVLDAETLEREARDLGLRPAGRRIVPASDAHVESTVVLLSAGASSDEGVVDA